MADAPTLEPTPAGVTNPPIENLSLNDQPHLTTISSLSSDAGSDVSGIGRDSQGRDVHFVVKNFGKKTEYADKVIWVQADFDADVGVRIAPDLVIRKFLAGGWQGGIYLLEDDAGNERKDVLLKVLHKSAVLGDLEKEWAIGQALNVLSNDDGYLPGFMKTLEALRVEGEKGIRGMLIERLNGHIVEDTLAEWKFNDIHYVRDMLYQTFRAMDRAVTLLGFKHADLRLTNIMEHYPDYPDKTNRQFKIIDYGLSSIQERTDQKLFQRLSTRIFKQIQDPEEMKRLFVNTLSPKAEFSNLSAAVYKLAWINHGDVYHVLASLSHYVDDKTWAEEDKPMVKQLAKLMRDVTGIRLYKKFKPRAQIEYKKENYETVVPHNAATNVKHAVRNAALSTKRFSRRIGSQASQIRKSNITPYKALRYKLFTCPVHASNLTAPSFNGVVLDKRHATMASERAAAEAANFPEGANGHSDDESTNFDEDDDETTQDTEADAEARAEAADLLNADEEIEQIEEGNDAAAAHAAAQGEVAAQEEVRNPMKRTRCVLSEALKSLGSLHKNSAAA